MNKLFSTKNLPWKIVSCIFAFILWVFVINTQNPTQPLEIAGVKIVISGLDQLEQAGYELINKDEILNQNFKVLINGPRLETDRISRNPKLITATLDLTNYLDDLSLQSISDTATYKISINTDGNAVSIKDKYPQVTKVLIEKIDSKEQKVTYEIDKSITDKYTLIGDEKPIITPEKVTITGAKSDIDRVSEAKVVITAENFSEDQLVSVLPIKLLDADGNEITGLQLSTDSVEVKLPIGTEKTVPIVLDLQGEMTEGYELVNTIVSPAEVTIIGKSDVLSGIHEIKLEPIDLSKITKTDLIRVNMILPNGVISLGDSSVGVSLEIVPENTLSYPIPSADLNLSVTGIGEGLTYEVLTPSINVILSALPNKLLTYETSDIKASLDLHGYLAGEYTLPLVITPPEGARVINSPININVRITEIKHENTEENTDDISSAEGEVEQPEDSSEDKIVENS